MTYLYSPQTQYAWPSTGYEQPRVQYSNGGGYAQGYNSLRDSMISTATTSFTNYVPAVSHQNNYSSPTYQSPQYYPVNYTSQPQSVPTQKSGSYFSFPSPSQTYAATSYPSGNGVSQAYNMPSYSFAPAQGSTSYSNTAQIGSATNVQQMTVNSNPLRQSIAHPSEQISPYTRLLDGRTSISSAADPRGYNQLRDSQSVSIYGAPIQLYGRSNSVGQPSPGADVLRASLYLQPQMDFTRNRTSTSVDTRSQAMNTYTQPISARPSMSFGQQAPNTQYPQIDSNLYAQPQNQTWMARPSVGNHQNGNVGEITKVPLAPLSNANFQAPHQGDMDMSFHSPKAARPSLNPNPQPAQESNQNSSGTFSPGNKSMSPQNKRNLLMPALSGASTTPSKPEVKNITVATTPGSFIISEPSTPSTPDPRGNQSTHGKSLRSIKLFETPSQNNHAYPTVGHQAYNPSVPLTMSHSAKGLPPVKIDIHTDSCYNYLNKRMYFENLESHTPLEQFFFRESIGQYKVAQMLAPHLPNVKLPTPLKIQRRKKYMLVLDIDETLVHSELVVEQNVPKPDKAHIAYDRKLEFPNPNGTFDVYGIRYRPFLMEFLHRMSKHYDLALYTASAQDYGNAVANELDPAGTLFVARLFRENCIHVNGVNVKSMRNFEGNDAYLIDNLIYSFPFDLDRGIPICPFVDDAMDVELKDLAEILENLPSFDSLHALVNELFGLKDFYGFLGKTIAKENNSSPISPIMKQHESSNQSSNDRTAAANTIYF